MISSILSRSSTIQTIHSCAGADSFHYCLPNDASQLAKFLRTLILKCLREGCWIEHLTPNQVSGFFEFFQGKRGKSLESESCKNLSRRRFKNLKTRRVQPTQIATCSNENPKHSYGFRHLWLAKITICCDFQSFPQFRPCLCRR